MQCRTAKILFRSLQLSSFEPAPAPAVTVDNMHAEPSDDDTLLTWSHIDATVDHYEVCGRVIPLAVPGETEQ